MGQYDSFVLRVWRRAAAGDGQWVGRLEHLQERESRIFHDADTLFSYLRATICPTDMSAIVASYLEATSPTSVLEHDGPVGGKGRTKDVESDDLIREGSDVSSATT